MPTTENTYQNITYTNEEGIPNELMEEKLSIDDMDIHLRSEEVQEILTRVPNWMIRWGSLLFLSLILMLLFISWFIKYPDIITAEAVITTEIPPQKEVAKTTGSIDAILVHDGQEVHKNTPLAIIENTANYQHVFILKKIIDQTQLSNQSITFPLDSIPMLFLGSIEGNYAVFENSYIQYQLNKELQPFANETMANEFSLSEAKAQLASSLSQRELSQTELRFKRKERNRYRDLYKKGVISQQEFENKQLEYLRARRDYNQMEVSLSQLKENISSVDKNAKTNTINKTREEIKLLKSVIQAFNQLKKSVADWEQSYVLKSNIDGNVSFINVWNKNQNVNAGDLVFTIIPSTHSSFIAKLKIPARNSGKLKKGQQVNIKMENYPDTEFGVLQGTVKNIAVITDKEGFYRMDVSLSDKLITSYNKEVRFKHEMRATAEVITEDLRLIERFFYQFKNILKKK